MRASDYRILHYRSSVSLSGPTGKICWYLAVFLLYSTAIGYSTGREEYRHGTPPSNVICTKDETSRIRGFRDNVGKDFIIGGLFALHSSATGSAGGRCSERIFPKGFERIEAFLYALDLVNNDKQLLQNIALGYDIRDTCVSENIALDETAHLVFPSYIDDDQSHCMETVLSSGNTSNITTNDILAIIGPTTSQVSLPVASLLRLFTVPHISYSASSPTLNNRDRYGYFYRTHPADDQEIRAMIDLALSIGWTYVSVVHSNNAYGAPATEIFKQIADEVGICIHLDIGLDEDFTTADYLNAANRLINESDPTVVVVFASFTYVEEFMQQLSIAQGTHKDNDARKFMWIASSSWAQATSISTKYSNIISGLLGFEIYTNAKSDFNQYFTQLTLNSNKRNPWFAEYYQSYYNCNISSNSCNRTAPLTSDPNYILRNHTQLVIDAVYSIAHALNGFLTDHCPNMSSPVTQTCRDRLDGTLLRNYISKVNFTSPSGNRVAFDTNGNINGQYEIVNFQRDSTGSHRFVSVGSWAENGGITLFNNVSIQYGADSKHPIRSQCHECPVGSIRVKVQSSCCGLCKPCQGNNYTNSTSATQCMSCPERSWGNDPIDGSNACEDIPEVYLDHSDPFGIVLMLVAIGGLASVVVVIVGMGIFWTTPVIKSSGREQMILILCGITASFLATVLYIIRPSLGACLIQRFFDATPFTLMLSALLIKLVRIARIFLNKSNAKTRFIDWKYQFLFTAPLVTVQIVLIVISLVITHPGTVTTQISNSDNSLDTPTVLLQCVQGNIVLSILQILYLGVLLVVTNLIGVLTLRFPDNFNEARYITFATLSMLLIWLSYLQTYFAVTGFYRTAILPFSLQLAAIAILGCFFFTRICKAIIVRNDNLKNANGGSTSHLTSNIVSSKFNKENS